MSSLVQRLHNEHKARRARLAAAAVADDGIDLKRKPPPPRRAPAPHTVLRRNDAETTTPLPETTSRRIIKATCERFAIRPSDLRSGVRTRNIAAPRQLCMYLLRRFTTLSYNQIGALLGGRDHTTIIHGVKAISARLSAETTKVVDELIVDLNLKELNAPDHQAGHRS